MLHAGMAATPQGPCLFLGFWLGADLRLSSAILHTVLSLFVAAIASAAHTGDGIAISRSGDEAIVELDRFDMLRQAHSGLNAVLKLRGPGKEKELAIDLTDAAVQRALVIDLAPFGPCHSITVTIKDAGEKVLAENTASPVPEITIESSLTFANAAEPASGERVAYIEPGIAAPANSVSALPRIPLPDGAQLRRVKLEPPARLVSKRQITYPVVAEVDYPLVGNSVVGRQTAAPDDPGKASLYFTCKKAIYDGPTLSRWQKFLLGAGDGDLGQKGEIDSDERGRIYWRVEGGGAYIVRFDPHTKKFEQPPCRIDFQALVPKGIGLLNDNLCKVTCRRGRVFFTMCNDTLSTGDPGNAHRRRLGGVFSIPQDWSDANAFAKDIRLHVGSWETARPAFYKTPPKADADVRKIGACGVTEAGSSSPPPGPSTRAAPVARWSSTGPARSSSPRLTVESSSWPRRPNPVLPR